MYIVKLCNDKSLLTTKYTSIYQGETGVTTIDFFIPKLIDNHSLTELSCRIEYMLPNGISNYIVPEKDNGDYGNYFLLHWTIPIELTRQSGRVRFWMIFEKLPEYNLVTSESYFDVEPTINIVNSISINDTITEEIDKLKKTKADSITINNRQEITLTSEGKLIGDTIQINKVKDLDE